MAAQPGWQISQDAAPSETMAQPATMGMPSRPELSAPGAQPLGLKASREPPRLATLAGSNWSERSIRQRLTVVRQFRKLLVQRLDELLSLLRGARTDQDQELLPSQIIPLVEAARFLEHQAATILKTTYHGRKGRPLWLSGVQSQVIRRPRGTVLLLCASNYPLFLTGVPLLQALVAGNSVWLKPALEGESVAHWLLATLLDAGLPAGLLQVLPATVQAGKEAVQARPDLVVLTGSQATGQEVGQACGALQIPIQFELSGCDAVVLLTGADLAQAAGCVAYGLTLNAGATCCGPRRIFVKEDQLGSFAEQLRQRLQSAAAVSLPERVKRELAAITADATMRQAAVLTGGWNRQGLFLPLVYSQATPRMQLFKSDIFAPVCGIVTYRDEAELLKWLDESPLHLGASLFGPQAACTAMAAKLRIGNVVINDVIVPTADPRLPFPAWRGSGPGVTRGADGLLAMTQPQVVSVRQGSWLPHLDPLTETTTEIFYGYLQWAHGGGVWRRISGLFRLIRAAMRQQQARRHQALPRSAEESQTRPQTLPVASSVVATSSRTASGAGAAESAVKHSD